MQLFKVAEEMQERGLSTGRKFNLASGLSIRRSNARCSGELQQQLYLGEGRLTRCKVSDNPYKSNDSSLS
jgi:hypothetical protein